MGDVFIVICHSAASCLAELLLKDNRCIDVSVIGEFENTLSELCALISEKKDYKRCKGIAYMNNGEYVVTDDRAISDIESISPPERDCFPNDTRFFHVYGSRGCEGRCGFCDRNILYTKTGGHGVTRFRDIDDVVSISQMDKPANEAMLMDICDKSGVLLKDESYKDGLNTMLGRDFDGIEISGGQWQRIAIARGLFRHSDLIILDEPTAAIDPLEETRLYNDFINICNDKTAILVTHRLGSAKIADRIIVLKDGQIVQDGNHRQLINTDGEYKRYV
ncbi:ATP-binding cassette domain-containing protein [Paenibacillus albidus]|uniref:ATP-binding cassette domain-containing protein n=1 Tax=Paenibacillus albidus TaxID=2041023 RepID=UPI0016643F66|nr:ATP-binding cassette domain-containing protein [Paenibacillus albidus]